MTAQLSGVDVRYVCVDGVEVIRRVYVAIRDRAWVSVEGVTQMMHVEESPGAFAVDFEVLHQFDNLRFSWAGRVEGRADGTFRYQMRGLAETAFDYRRIGICVLHPPAQTAGRPFRMRVADGVLEGRMPFDVGPMGSEGGVSRPLFEPFSAVAIALADDGELSFSFEGDQFEIEDQRNWADGSFKTYSTPIASGLPYSLGTGDSLDQSVELDARTVAKHSDTRAWGDTGVHLSIGEPTGMMLPPIGFAVASHGAPLEPREAALLRALVPGHLRVDLHIDDQAAPAVLARARDDASQLDCPLELAIHLRGRELPTLTTVLAGTRAAELVRVLCFDADARGGTPSETTPPGLARSVRELLPAGVPVGGGSDRFFCELNRTRPDVEALEVIAFPTNATYHESDLLSLVETLEAQGDAVRTAVGFSGGRPVAAGPVTLAFRNAPYGPGRSGAPRQLPPEVDARQMSLFAAPWTLGSVKYQSEAGAASLTYYETTGWRGLVETETGAPLPAEFPSLPGAAFPLWFTFAALAGFRGAQLLACESAAPLRVVGLALRRENEVSAIVGNLTAIEQTVTIRGLPEGSGVDAVEWLGERDLPAALLAPESHLPRVLTTSHGRDVTLQLSPYALAIITSRRR